RRRHTRFSRDWSSDVCSSDLFLARMNLPEAIVPPRGPGQRQLPDTADASAGSSAYLRPFFVNSVHGLDLIQFVFGDVEIGHVARSEERRVGKGCRCRWVLYSI